MKNVKWVILLIGVISIVFYFSGPLQEFVQGVYDGYQEKAAEQKRIEEQQRWPLASKVQYPIKKEDFFKLDIFQFVKRISKEDPITYNFIYGNTKVPMESDRFRQLHPDTRHLYDTCQSTIDADPWLTEYYTHLISDEILGLNSEMTRISGAVDMYSESVGRDYVYYIVDNQLKYLMEGLSERGSEILIENLRASDEKLHRYKLYTPSESDLDSDNDFTKTIGDFLILTHCMLPDIKLGLTGFGTNFQVRAQQAADMVQRKINLERSEESKKRRQKLNDTLELLNNLK